MNKYLALLKSFFSSAMIKRADFLSNIIVNLIQIFAIVVLWFAIYDPKKTIAGYTLSDTVIYYVIILLITYISTTNTADYISQNIKYGSFSEWLLKPRSILLTELSRSFGEQMYRLLILIPIYFILVILLFVFKINFVLTFQGVLLGSLFIILGFFLNCLFEYNLSMFSFWMDEVWSIKHFKEVITDLLGGKRIPLAFFPLIVQNISKFLPFQFIYFIPAQYVLNKHTININLAEDLFFVFSWIIFFIIFSSFLYKRGIQKYGAFGN